MELLEKLNRLATDGVPVNVAAEPETLRTAGTYIVAGLVLCGLIVGLIVGGAIWVTKK